MFENVGEKLKNFATVDFYIGMIGSCIWFLYCLINGMGMMSIIPIILAFATLPSAWFLYGIGELFINVNDIKKYNMANEVQMHDELPKL